MPVPVAAELFAVTDRVAVVTGASSGLGERFARVLHAGGAQVVAVARRTDRLTALSAELPGLTVLPADVTDPSALERLVDDVIGRHGRIDILVNNAGGGPSVTALAEPLEDFRAGLELNLVGHFHLSRLVAGHMIDAGGGSIVNVASILGLVASSPIPNASYVAAKGALVQLTRELGCQWARKHVRVNAIAPGFFPTEATADAVTNSAFTDHVARNCPMGRLGEPQELDGVLLFLASSAASYVTGQTFVVDGGWTAR